ncbi:MAG: hypothetical protein R2751_00440 [Bacteroidales bacterium]
MSSRDFVHRTRQAFPPGRVCLVLFLVGWIGLSLKGQEPGYRDIAPQGDGFVAVGSGGRVDRLDPKGRLRSTSRMGDGTWHAVLCHGDEVWLAGEAGGLAHVAGDSIRQVKTGFRDDLLCLETFRGSVFAGGDGGRLLRTVDGRASVFVDLPVSGSIVSLSATPARLYAVTREGFILSTADGSTWTCLDFNRTYRGYVKPCRFVRVLATEQRVVVLAEYEEGGPVALYSTDGDVWTERPFVYQDGEGRWQRSGQQPLDLAHDPERDHYVVACSGGEVFCLPSCTRCNTSHRISDGDLRGICSGNGRNVAVGDGFETMVLFL